MARRSGKFELDRGGISVTLAVMRIETIDLGFQGLSGAIASFLVQGPEGCFLVETGPASTRETLISELASRGVEPADLAGILVTHVHLDHSGAAHWFADRGVPVYVHPRGVKHLADPSKLVAGAREVYGERFDELWGETGPAPSEQLFAVEGGDTVSIGGLEIEALDTPGHAFHHHAFAVGDAIFAGDAAGARLDDSGYVSVTAAPPQFHLEHELASLDGLIARHPSELYLTHFGPAPDPAAHLADYRDAVELNATFVRQRLEEGMDAESLRIAYQAFNMEQSFRCGTDRDVWEAIQEINGTAMCADGIRLYWEKQWSKGT